jgi:hypothetical protein
MTEDRALLWLRTVATRVARHAEAGHG